MARNDALQRRQPAVAAPGLRPSSTARPATCAAGDQAGADLLAVEQHRAGAAIAGIAADLGAGQAELVAQRAARRVRRRSVGRDAAVPFSVEGECSAVGKGLSRQPWRARDAASSARRSSVAPRRGDRRRWRARRRSASAPARCCRRHDAARPAPTGSADERGLERRQALRRPPSRRRRRRAPRRCGPRPRLQDRGDHGDRDDEIAPRAELEERRRARGVAASRHQDRGDELARRAARCGGCRG